MIDALQIPPHRCAILWLSKVTVGLHIAKHVFQVHGVDQNAILFFEGSCGDRKVSASSIN
jgi:hypothetical protein